MSKKTISGFELLDKITCTALCRIKGEVVLFGGFSGYHQHIIDKELPWPRIMVHGGMNTFEDRVLNPFDFLFLCSMFKGDSIDFATMTVKQKIFHVGTPEELDRSENLIKFSFQGPDSSFLKETGVPAKWRNQYLKEKKFFLLKNAKGKSFQLRQLLSSKEFGNELPGKWSVERKTNMVFMIKDHETGESMKLDITPGKKETISPAWPVPPYYGGFPAALAFSLQVLGYGSPFQAKGPTTCMLLRLNGLSVLVDCCPFWDLLAMQTGVSIYEIDSLILTHCHEDHMGGLLKLIRRGKKVRIYTVREIFEMMIRIISWQLDQPVDEVMVHFDFHEVEIDQWNIIAGTEFYFQYTSHPIPCISVKARKRMLHGLPAEVQITSDTVGMTCAQEMLSQGVINQKRYDQLMSIFEGEVTIADGGEAGLHPAIQDFMGHDVRATFLGHRQDEKNEAPMHFSFVEPYHLFPFENLSVASVISRAIDSFLKPFSDIDMGRWAQILREAADYRPVAKGQLIVQEKMEDEGFMFIIGFGLFSVISNNQEVAILHSGHFFGEQVFVTGSKKRTAHVKALSYGIIVMLNAHIIKEFLESNPDVKTRFLNLTEARELLSRTMIFGELDATEKTHLALSLNKIRLNAGDYLIRKGGTENNGYVLAKGVLKIPGTDIIFKPPAIVGEFAAADFTPLRTADVKAREDLTIVYEITYDDIQRLMESNPDIEKKLKELARSRGLKI